MESSKLRLRPSRPRSQLRLVIDRTTALRKTLQRLRSRGSGGITSGNVRDALRTIWWMQRLASLGIRSEAADAIVIAEHLDKLSQVLDKQIDEILASYKHVRTW